MLGVRTGRVLVFLREGVVLWLLSRRSAGSVTVDLGSGFEHLRGRGFEDLFVGAAPIPLWSPFCGSLWIFNEGDNYTKPDLGRFQVRATEWLYGKNE